MKQTLRESVQAAIGLTSIVWFSFGCTAPVAVSTPTTAAPTPISAPTSAPTNQGRGDQLSVAQVATLSSLKKVDDYPLYTMHYHGAYDERQGSDIDVESLRMGGQPDHEQAMTPPAWACSLFAALGDARNMLLGRNFDWNYSPAVLLFTDPPDGFASVSMVDITYLGFGGAKAAELTDLPLIEREALLNAPFIPFDGMNEQGLAVGMAAVPPGGMVLDPARETTGSLMVLRKVLDQASDIGDAVAIFRSYNIDMEGGPPLHYLIAAQSGESVLVEFYQGEMHVIPNEGPWHLATNFLRASFEGAAAGVCPRYDTLNARLAEAEGRLSANSALDLLAEVSQPGTQWSVVYGISTGEVSVIMAQQYDNVRTFRLTPAVD